MGGKIDTSVHHGKSPPVFRLHGQNYHMIGSLLPTEGSIPKFAQLYIYDTANEVANRMNVVGRTSETTKFHGDIVKDLQDMLDEHNVLVKSFRMVRESMRKPDYSEVKLRLIGKRFADGRRYNLPSAEEVAGLVPGDFETALGERDIVVETRSGLLKRINELNPSYLGLQYPLLFVYGQDGYREDVQLKNSRSGSSGARKKLSMREFFSYRLQERDCESPHILFSRKLFQQFLVDAYTMVETSRLNYVRTHQKQLRCDIYNGLADALLRGETNLSTQRKRVVLPSTFTGGARYMIQNYQDAMAICRWVGYPDLFITFTCNPKWPEVIRFLENRSLKSEDRPDILCRIFKVKLDHLMKDLRQNKVFGTVRAVVYTIEFQKRGLPHAHILLFLSQDAKYPTGDDIDRIISAEIPDESIDPKYYAAVRDLMIHGPCGSLRRSSPCMVNGQCSKHFPKKFAEFTNVDDDGYPIYRRRDNGITVNKSGIDLDNRFVVPHNRYLLLKYGAHINVEWCNQSRSIKYLFKYVNKGHDRVTASFYQTAAGENNNKQVDEISMYYDCRYISSCEAAWRMFGYDIHYRNPPVERLSFHLPNQQNIFFSDSDHIDDVLSRPSVKESMFTAWMDANRKYKAARELTYAEFPTKFVWKHEQREWLPRQRGFSIGRIFYVPPGCGEMYYLRTLLNIVRGPKSYEEIRCVNGVQYDSFRDACYALGLLDDDKEYIDGIVEASHWGSAQSLRNLFATLLASDSLSRPEYVWEQCWLLLSDDILHRQRCVLAHEDLELSEEELKNYVLLEIEKILRSRGKSLREFKSMPFPYEIDISFSENRLIHDEMRYDRRSLAEDHKLFVSRLTDEQRSVYDMIMSDVQSDQGGVFFLYGCGGTGKTFIWKTLSAGLRSKGEVVLNVASSGIASLLLPGGRTAHSRFAIPLNPTEDSTCNIKQGSPLAELILKTKLIIWDEAPMMHRYCFEALDKSLRDIMRFKNPLSLDQPFGGKTVVFGGDFRQILPVIPKGSRQDIVHATINSSYLWRHCKVLKLTKNMRLQNLIDNDHNVYLKEFSEWISSIGDGILGGRNDGHATVEIPDDILIHGSSNMIESIVETTYPSFSNNVGNTSYLQGRAILAPTLDVVESVNDYMISISDCEGTTYFSSDTICRSDTNIDLLEDLHSTEFLNSIKCSGVPNHELRLKVGIPVMLLRNIDHTAGLCNGTRLIVTRLGSHVLEATILSGTNAGHKVLIPRISLTPSDTRLPFKFQRRQFPLIVSYAMTINKSQGQSLTHVGLFLKKPLFSHGTVRCNIKSYKSQWVKGANM
ncbi:uncharacterized protein LOC127811252 [Diospyros lotus]|uniref:uncharacterized protein LOC127811252 n=1 Tax=Diospyros lotus TaxID=55363 RepID=UPI0022580860|nr:uncharacterized protein LOC127811252 [Diospyros lotus]